MVWIKYKEKYHGSISSFWKKKPTTASAKSEIRQWNKYNNPYEHLSITKITKRKPINIKKTRYSGIYK